MLHIRVTAPESLSDQVVGLVNEFPYSVNVARYKGASISPAGDVITADLPREATDTLINQLEATGVMVEGGIALENIDTTLSHKAADAEKRAPGEGADAIVWEEVVSRTSEDATLSGAFLTFMILASLISGLAIIFDSPILLIGAMVVGPEFGPLAGFAVALVHGQRGQAMKSFLALLVGFPVGIFLTFLGVEILNVLGRLPADLDSGHRPLTGFIAQPDEYSALVALLAGVAGMVALTSAKSGPLLGVLVSVTTIPATANLAIAMAIGEWGDARGSVVQLLINLGCLLVASVSTLYVQSLLTRRDTKKSSA